MNVFLYITCLCTKATRSAFVIENNFVQQTLANRIQSESTQILCVISVTIRTPDQILKERINKTQYFAIWCHRRTLRISWIQRTTDIEVIRKIGKEYEGKNKRTTGRRVSWLRIFHDGFKRIKTELP